MVLATNALTVTTEWIPIDTLTSRNVDSGTIRVVRFTFPLYIMAYSFNEVFVCGQSSRFIVASHRLYGLTSAKAPSVWVANSRQWVATFLSFAGHISVFMSLRQTSPKGGV